MVANNKKYTVKVIAEYMRKNHGEYEVLEIQDSCSENNFKPKVRFTNGFETKFAYFDNILRGKFSFSLYTPKYVKELIEEYTGLRVVSVEAIGEHNFNHKTKFKIINEFNDEIILDGSYLSTCIRKSISLFHGRRMARWTEEEIYNFLSEEKYGLSNIVVRKVDETKEFTQRNCTVSFTYDKVELECSFRAIRDRLRTGNDEYINLNRGEAFYKDLLKNKFGIKNIGFDRLYKHTTSSGKMTFVADIYNIETGDKAKGVLTDNLKKRGYWFKTYEGEVKIAKKLSELGVEYESQKTFEDCIHQTRLKFDFYIPSINTCIEYDGEFHYIPISFVGGEKALKRQQERDRVKNEYCENKNINLVRVPYFEKHSIDQVIEDIVSTYWKQ